MKITTIDSNEKPNIGDVVRDGIGDLALVYITDPKYNLYKVKYLTRNKEDVIYINYVNTFNNTHKNTNKVDIYLVDENLELDSNTPVIANGIYYSRYFNIKDTNLDTEDTVAVIATTNGDKDLHKLTDGAIGLIVACNGVLSGFDVRYNYEYVIEDGMANTSKEPICIGVDIIRKGIDTKEHDAIINLINGTTEEDEDIKEGADVCESCSGSGYYCGRKCGNCNGTGRRYWDSYTVEHIQEKFAALGISYGKEWLYKLMNGRIIK